MRPILQQELIDEGLQAGGGGVGLIATPVLWGHGGCVVYLSTKR